MNQKISTLIAYVSYTVGLLIGLYLVVVVAWADMEAAFYGFSRLANAGLSGLSCPPLMTREEISSISLRVSNTADNPISPAVRVEVSTPLMLQEYNEKLRIEPGESQTLEWAVGPENIDLRRFIFAKALVFSAFPRPNQEATCGIYIINLPGNGMAVLAVTIALSLLGMGWGLYGMRKSAASDEWAQKHVVRPMTFLAAIVLLGFVTSSTGGWVPTMLVLAVAVLMVFILLGTLVMSEHKG